MNREALIIAITAGALSLASCSFGELQIVDQVANLVATPDSVPATDPPPPAVLFVQCDTNGGFAEEGHCPPSSAPLVQCDANGGFAPEGQCATPSTRPPETQPTNLLVQCADNSVAVEGQCPTDVMVASG